MIVTIRQHFDPGCGGRSSGPAVRVAGFTTLELVIVMVLVAVLAFVAIPRLDIGALKVAPVAEQIAAELRYAQNLALTRAQPHTLTVSGNSISISGSAGASLSTGEASRSFEDVSLSGASIEFGARFGQTAGGSITVDAGTSSAMVVISPETGHVRIEE